MTVTLAKPDHLRGASEMVQTGPDHIVGAVKLIQTGPELLDHAFAGDRPTCELCGARDALHPAADWQDTYDSEMARQDVFDRGYEDGRASVLDSAVLSSAEVKIGAYDDEPLGVATLQYICLNDGSDPALRMTAAGARRLAAALLAAAAGLDGGAR